MVTYFIIYLLIINIFSFMLMYVDKQKSKKHKWRIKEKSLFISAISGGSIGSLLGMHIFRHKTKHNSFKIGIPIIFLIHLVILITILYSLSYL